jgi:NADPH-dependent ferric siderophore reductase
VRREPPNFRRVEVQRVEPVSPRLTRITLGGSALAGMEVAQPAASVRLLLPSPGAVELVIPSWNGNEFLMPDGSRPVIRTFTPLRHDASAHELDIEVVIHGTGSASQWAEGASPGDAAALSGPGRGYDIDSEAGTFLLAGDETALPAIRQLLDLLPTDARVGVRLEIASEDARIDLPERDGSVEWALLPEGAAPGDALLASIRDTAIEPDTRVWVAGEAAGVQRIRKHLFDDRGFTRAQATVRGYWKHGRAGGDDT